MSATEINAKVKELRELRRMADELAAELEAVQHSIKSQLDAQGVDTLAGADWKVTWRPVTSTRLGSSALKKGLPELAAPVMKQTTTRRFVLA